MISQQEQSILSLTLKLFFVVKKINVGCTSYFLLVLFWSSVRITATAG